MFLPAPTTATRDFSMVPALALRMLAKHSAMPQCGAQTRAFDC